LLEDNNFKNIEILMHTECI